MARVGERLRLEREGRNTSLADLSDASGIGQSYLDALERGEIDELPGPAFGKLYIRAYAEVLGFDPQPWIDDYDRERRLESAPDVDLPTTAPAGNRRVAAALARWKESKVAETAQAVEDPVVEIPEPQPEPEPVPDPEPLPEPMIEPEIMLPSPAPAPAVAARLEEPRRSMVKPVAAALGILVIVLAAAWAFIPESTPVLPPTPPVVQDPPRTEALPVPVDPKPAAPPAPSQRTHERIGALTIAESGTGRRVVNTRLEGEGSEFSEGESVAFQTRVLGGARGDSIRHVWIHDGRAQQSITLRIGGPDWRTYSKKTLFRRGPWTVEARDKAGRVLASASFTCHPAGRNR